MLTFSTVTQFHMQRIGSCIVVLVAVELVCCALLGRLPIVVPIECPATPL